MLFVYKVKYLFAYIPQMCTYSLNSKLEIACLTPTSNFTHLCSPSDIPLAPQLSPSM